LRAKTAGIDFAGLAGRINPWGLRGVARPANAPADGDRSMGTTRHQAGYRRRSLLRGVLLRGGLLVAAATFWSAGGPTSAADPPPLVPLRLAAPAELPAPPPAFRLDKPQAGDGLTEAVATDEPGGDVAGAPAAPLPDAAWSDPDGVNWIDSWGNPAARPAAPRSGPAGRVLDRLGERRSEARGSEPGSPRRPGSAMVERVRSRLRSEGRLARVPSHPAGGPVDLADISDGWPTPTRLLDELESLAAATRAGRPHVSNWATRTLDALHATLETDGPTDPRAGETLLVLGEQVTAGMSAADLGVPSPLASQTRRVALAVARRVAVWRAAAALCVEAEAEAAAEATLAASGIALPPPTSSLGPRAIAMLGFLERYETGGEPADAAAIRTALEAILAGGSAAEADLGRAIADHYHAPNVRIAVHREFVERMLPEATVTNGPVQDFVLGRPVRGRSTVEQSTAVRFVPHPGEIRLELVVNGEVASRTVTSSGPVSIHSRGQATFSVFKPIVVTAEGPAFAPARGTASSRAQLASIETNFDNVPIMGPLVRSIARSQHDDARQEANREVSGKIVGRACRQVDQEAEPKLAEMAERIRDRLWQPLVTLGLEPTPVGLETTEDVASVRLRLASPSQLAAHTPRPRAPDGALVSGQVHDTVANNAIDRLDLAGRRLDLTQLAAHVCQRLGIEPKEPADLPDGVLVTFAREAPLRVQSRDGLVHVRVALDAFESGRRCWHEIVVKVAYRPVVRGPQVFLEREGPVQIGGPAHEGRMEIGLRTIFGKIFAKERPVPIVPASVTANPRLAGLRVVQAVATDGWLGIALAQPAENMTGQPADLSPTAEQPPAADRRLLRR
jgi:hypothetical protein